MSGYYLRGIPVEKEQKKKKKDECRLPFFTTQILFEF